MMSEVNQDLTLRGPNENPTKLAYNIRPYSLLLVFCAHTSSYIVIDVDVIYEHFLSLY